MKRPLTLVATLSLLALCTSAAAQTAREVTYTPQSVVPLRAKVRFTTMVILPEQEEILDFVCGDKEFWVVSGGQNLAYIKPAKAGVTTNLNLVTASGHVYSFVLTEGTTDPDLKVFVTPDASMRLPKAGPQKFYSAAQVEEIRREAEDSIAVSVSVQGEPAAVQRVGDLYGRQVHLHPCGCERAAGPVRAG
jgi:type IV secretion system protein VirB9